MIIKYYEWKVISQIDQRMSWWLEWLICELLRINSRLIQGGVPKVRTLPNGRKGKHCRVRTIQILGELRSCGHFPKTHKHSYKNIITQTLTHHTSLHLHDSFYYLIRLRISGTLRTSRSHFFGFCQSSWSCLHSSTCRRLFSLCVLHVTSCCLITLFHLAETSIPTTTLFYVFCYWNGDVPLTVHPPLTQRAPLDNYDKTMNYMF